MSPRLTPAARTLLRSQRLVIATWQGAGVGLSSRAMRRAAQGRGWTAVADRTFLAIDAEPALDQMRVAATLELGPKALLGGQSALVEHGWSGRPAKQIDVVVPRGAVAAQRKAPLWVNLHWRVNPADARGVVPLVAAAESVLDASAWARTDREAMFIAVSCLQQRITTARALARAIAARPHLARAGMVRAIVAEFRAGATAMGELDLRRLCRAHGVPLPISQRRRRDSRGEPRFIDAEFVAADGATVMVEIDGVGHFDIEAWYSDMKRQRRLVLPNGVRQVRGTTWELRYEPEEFFQDLRAALGVQGPDH